MKKYLVLLALVTIISCDSDHKIPGIKIISPEEGQTFASGNNVNIKVKISDDGDSIMNEELFVITQSNDTIVNIKNGDFCFEYEFDENIQVQSNTQYKIIVKARGGHGNWNSKTINIICN
ncbi:Ig-like domain-containing protein [Flavobacterium terrigena]|uniref:DUF4625 domain-containing protein n=1 Tax=Flavobacterium terrigena TaxID=402734 RepID=A0A1H6UM11_9FLAO|nr:Ig-like domain-containing protein [Flavobacterium terrigena]SEI89260.1 hypothetical protein SAMN05660918_1837 [Flavobacterium terrigena]